MKTPTGHHRIRNQGRRRPRKAVTPEKERCPQQSGAGSPPCAPPSRCHLASATVAGWPRSTAVGTAAPVAPLPPPSSVAAAAAPDVRVGGANLEGRGGGDSRRDNDNDDSKTESGSGSGCDSGNDGGCNDFHSHNYRDRSHDGKRDGGMGRWGGVRVRRWCRTALLPACSIERRVAHLGYPLSRGVTTIAR